jgi:hypothetical protein
VALRTPEKALLGPFRTPYSGRIRAPSVARTLFGQFQKAGSRELPFQPARTLCSATDRAHASTLAGYSEG